MAISKKNLMDGTAAPPPMELQDSPNSEQDIAVNAASGPTSPPKFQTADRRPTARRRHDAPPPTGPPPRRKFLSYLDLQQRGIRYSRVHLRGMENAGLFPAHVDLGAGDTTQTAKAWIEEEIDAWQEAKIAARDARIAERLAQEQPCGPLAAEDGGGQ
jgi:predicted DNA-binding transcriptional regulator AlpA